MSHHRLRSALNIIDLMLLQMQINQLWRNEINDIPVVNELLQQQINVGEQWKSYEI